STSPGGASDHPPHRLRKGNKRTHDRDKRQGHQGRQPIAPFPRDEPKAESNQDQRAEPEEEPLKERRLFVPDSVREPMKDQYYPKNDCENAADPLFGALAQRFSHGLLRLRTSDRQRPCAEIRWGPFAE